MSVNQSNSPARHGNLKSVKEIASDLGRSRTYVHAAKSAMLECGIKWPCGMISTEAFVSWVTANDFTCTDFVRAKK